MKITNNILILVLLCVLVSFCKKEQLINEIPIKVSFSTIGFDQKGTAVKNIEINGSKNFEYEIAQDGKEWLSVEKLPSSLKITAKENTSLSERQTKIKIYNSVSEVDVKVVQFGKKKVIFTDKLAYTISSLGGEQKIIVNSNVEFKVNIPEGINWIHEKKEPLSRNGDTDLTEKKINLVIDINTSGTERRTDLELLETNNDKPYRSSITIIQKGKEDYTPVNSADIKPDIKISVLSGETSSQQNGSGDFKFSFDGDPATMWHSSWSNSSPTYFPIYATYHFPQNTHIDYIIYTPRQDGSSNGCFKEFDLQIKKRTGSNAGQFITVSSHDFKGSHSPTKISLKENNDDIESVRFVIKSGAGDGQGFASCAEMTFYKLNDENYDPSQLFSDATCSELKPGISEEDISKCTSMFYKNIALHLLRGDYPKESRIQEFRAYPLPDMVQRQYKTSKYGLYDNVTGIYVKENDTVIIFAGNLEGKNVSIKLQNLDNPSGNGWGNTEEHVLSEGLNRFVASKNGLLYVMYHTPNFKNEQNIKLHFASGIINGYFDLVKHTNTDWTRLIQEAQGPYFDLLGRFVHISWPVDKLRTITKDKGKQLVEAFDAIVANEWALEGNYFYNKPYYNRMHLITVGGDAYMFATDYYTAYNYNTLSGIAVPSKLKTDNCWGPAHEIGHVNQTRPGLKWLGTTEVTNNIMSEYIQTTVFKQPSRLQNESITDNGKGIDYPNRYAKAYNLYFVEQAPHGNASDGDPFCKLVPFWQLQLYFGNVLGRTPKVINPGESTNSIGEVPDNYKEYGGFYPDLYEYIRMSEDQPNAGYQQTEFVLSVCKIAKMNLLDFFEKWGFLKPVNAVIDDYGKGTMQVTQQRVDDIKNKVKNLNYPKPDLALEYISDLNYDMYKNPQKVSPGSSAILRNNEFTISGWQNVVAYEIRDKNNTLKFASEGKRSKGDVAKFKIAGGIWNNECKLYAISARGERVEISIN